MTKRLATFGPAWTVFALTAASISACDKPEATVPDEAPPSAEKPSYEALSSESDLGKQVIAAMDTSVDPCQDFYQFACGGWLAATELPADKPSYGRGFTQLRDSNAQSIKSLLASAATAEGQLAKAGRFYAACMDESAVENAAPKALSWALKGIDRVKNTKTLARYLGQGHGRQLGSALFSVGQSNDFKDPDLYILDLGQGGLGLPDRSYYLEERRKPMLDFYRGYVEKMLVFAGVPASKAKERAAAVVDFEAKLAEVSKPRDQLRDPEKVYNPTRIDDLAAKSPGFPWKAYLKQLGTNNLETVNLSVPGFIEAFPEIVQSSSFAVIRDYLRAHVVDRAAPHLSKDIVDANFSLAQKMRGQKQIQARWERCVGMTTRSFPDVVARAYVDEHFAGDSKQTALDMIHDIEAAFEDALPGLEWMDETTRGRALDKKNAVANKIGYPNKWRDYAKLDAGSAHYANIRASAEFHWRESLAEIGTRVDPDKWHIPASMVNAFYNPLQNEMVFPAGILQPPFFSKDFPRAMNYGGIGMAMGHELTHGFDDSGRKFDGEGVMREWWASEVSERFEGRAECIEKAYSEVEIQPEVHINGKLTLGENIADFGGMKLTAAAYQRYVKKNGPEPALIDGLSNEQLLFLAFGQAWCTKASPEFARMLVTVDPHSPPEQRVNLTLAHLPAFRQAYQCGEEAPMHEANSCEVW